MINDKITYQYYLRGTLELMSPLMIGSGESINSDKDLVRNHDGIVFIPGTSIAGVIRSYLENNYANNLKLISYLFGGSEKDAKQSLFSFYDAIPVNKPEIVIRNGVALNYKTRTAKDKRKYDYELVERGCCFDFRLKLEIRKYQLEKMKEFIADNRSVHNITAYIEDVIYQLVKNINKQNIRFGGKTKRGFGSVKLNDIKLLKLDFVNNRDFSTQQWINFEWSSFDSNDSIKSFNHSKLQKQTKDVVIKVRFEIPHSLLIRFPSSLMSGQDSQQLYSEGKPVIPGTTWTGAIRNAITSVGEELDRKEKVEMMINEIFGYVDEGKATARASRLRIDESIVFKSKLIDYTRNRIDRFTGGVINAALFTEAPVFKGEVLLKLVFTKYDSDMDASHIGLLLLGLQDLMQGIQPVGGGVNVGRGILKGINLEISIGDEIFIIDKEQIERFEYSDRIYEEFMGPLAANLQEESQ